MRDAWKRGVINVNDYRRPGRCGKSVVKRLWRGDKQVTEEDFVPLFDTEKKKTPRRLYRDVGVLIRVVHLSH